MKENYDITKNLTEEEKKQHLIEILNYMNKHKIKLFIELIYTYSRYIKIKIKGVFKK